jgi:hypothetical protein
MKTFGGIVKKNTQINANTNANSRKSEEKKSFFGNFKRIMNREMGGEAKDHAYRQAGEVRSMKYEGRERVRPEAEQSTLQGALKCIYSTSGRHWLLMVLVFLLPLWFLPWGGDKLGLAKQLLITIVVGIGFLMWIYESMSNGKIVYKKSRINTGILVLLLAFLLSTIFSLHPATSIYGSSANFGNLWNFIILFGVYFLIVNDKRPLKNADINAEKTLISMEDMGEKREDKKTLRNTNLINVFLVSTGLVVFYALLKILGINILGGFTKGIGFNTIGTMNSVAILAGMGLVTILSKLSLSEKLKIKSEKLWKRSFVVIGILSFVFIILANFAPVWYGLILAMIIMIVFQARKGGQIQMKTFSLPIAVLAVSIVFALWGAFGVRIGLEQPRVNLKNLPAEVYLSYKTSLDIAGKIINQSKDLKQSFFGVGLGNFNKSWLLHKPVDLNQTDFWQTSFIQGFSSFTTLITETGYFGILAIVIFLALVFKEIFSFSKESKEKKTAVLIPENQKNKELSFMHIEKILPVVFLIAMGFFY